MYEFVCVSAWSGVLLGASMGAPPGLLCVFCTLVFLDNLLVWHGSARDIHTSLPMFPQVSEGQASCSQRGAAIARNRDECEGGRSCFEGEAYGAG